MAKKAESTIKNMMLSLTVIALVAAAALATLNAVTKEDIAKVETEKVSKAIQAVLQQTDENGQVTNQIEFTDLRNATVYINRPAEGGVTYSLEQAEGVKYTDSVVCHLAYTADGTLAGAAVEAADPNGFGGYFKVMVGFDAAGNVYGYSILKTSETPGLGAKADTWFQRGQKGDIIGMSATSELKVKKDKGEVDAITGSTITSRAFLRCVNKAYASLQCAVAPTAALDLVDAEEQVTECVTNN